MNWKRTTYGPWTEESLTVEGLLHDVRVTYRPLPEFVAEHWLFGSDGGLPSRNLAATTWDDARREALSLVLEQLAGVGSRVAGMLAVPAGEGSPCAS